jgi:hypothetical protein
MQSSRKITCKSAAIRTPQVKPQIPLPNAPPNWKPEVGQVSMAKSGCSRRMPRSQLSSAYSNPLNYLAQSGAPELGTMQQIAQIVQGLAGNGQIATPNSTIVKQPGAYDYALGTVSALGSL